MWKLRHTGVGHPNGEGKGVSFCGGLWLVTKLDLSGLGTKKSGKSAGASLGRKPGPLRAVPWWETLPLCPAVALG